MNESEFQRLEKQLRAAGKSLPYPQTPGIAASVMRRFERTASLRRVRTRWAWAAVTLLVLLSALMLVPPARAALLDFIQIGVVRIFRMRPAPAPSEAPEIQAPVTATPAAPSSATIVATASLPSPLQNLAGERTLVEAKARLGFPLMLPTYPPDLGPPDRVYLQNLGSSALLLVWLDRSQSGHVLMSLNEIAPGSWTVDKFNPPVIEEAKVNGNRAVWTEGTYFLEIRNGNYDQRQLVEGHVLIWTRAKITYRLETEAPLEEAIKIAESLEPNP